MRLTLVDLVIDVRLERQRAAVVPFDRHGAARRLAHLVGEVREGLPGDRQLHELPALFLPVLLEVPPPLGDRAGRRALQQPEVGLCRQDKQR